MEYIVIGACAALAWIQSSSSLAQITLSLYALCGSLFISGCMAFYPPTRLLLYCIVLLTWAVSIFLISLISTCRSTQGVCQRMYHMCPNDCWFTGWVVLPCHLERDTWTQLQETRSRGPVLLNLQLWPTPGSILSMGLCVRRHLPTLCFALHVPLHIPACT